MTDQRIIIPPKMLATANSGKEVRKMSNLLETMKALVAYSPDKYVRYADSPRVLEILSELDALDGDSEIPLTLTDVVISHNDASETRQARGSKGISSYGRRQVRQGVWCLEQLYGNSSLGFLTVTLPPFPERDDIFSFLLADFSELRRRFCQEVEREFSRRGFRFDYVCVVEIQEGRFERFGDPAPHLHFCYRCRERPKSAFYLTASEFRAIWRSVLVGRVSGVFGGCPPFFSNRAINCQVIKKSASRYLSKYLSKGGKVLARMKSIGLSSFIPSSWFGMPRRLGSYLKSLVVPLPVDFCQRLFLGEDFVSEGIAVYCSPIERDGFVFGYSGCLTLVSVVSLEDYSSG
jgi:hypothetical protein